ncbi:unnamed protein product [Dicrocoelium dendriticum]|nr:unnamed protein product [Dicrocoelium dendriticum]
MPVLRPLEFRDCVVDGPGFRDALKMHEKELKACNKQVKEVYNNAERVFKAMDQLHQSMRDFAASLSYCSLSSSQRIPTDDEVSCGSSSGDWNKTGVAEISETEDEVTIRTAFSEIANILQNVEDARETMLEPIKSVVLTEINELRTVWLAGHKTDPKAFLKETASFCQKLEKYLAVKQKENMTESAENFRQICDETRVLKEKLLNTHWEQIQPFDSAAVREGYLFIPIKKAVTTLWIKHFCVYDRRDKILKVTAYTQGRTSDSSTECHEVKSCTRRSSDSIDRRFCFDVEVENRHTPLTLQAQSLEDLHEWLLIMDGKEPLYADRSADVKVPERNVLNKRGYEFLCNLLKAIEAADLRTPGLYRVSGVQSKISTLVQQALSPSGFPWDTLKDQDIHLLTGAVKHFVRHLDEPLMTYGLHDQFLVAIKNDPSGRLPELARLLGLLPPDNWKALKLLTGHLSKVTAESDYNGMTASNLGIVFAPSLMRSSEETVAAIMNTKFACIAIQLMIENHATLFGTMDSRPGQLPRIQHPSQPLCAAPLLNRIRPSPEGLLVLRNAPAPATQHKGSSRPLVPPNLVRNVEPIQRRRAPVSQPIFISGIHPPDSMESDADAVSQGKELPPQTFVHDWVQTSAMRDTSLGDLRSNHSSVALPRINQRNVVTSDGWLSTSYLIRDTHTHRVQS